MLTNWVPGASATMRPPHPMKGSNIRGARSAATPEGCWRVNVANKDWDDSIGVAWTLTCPDNSLLKVTSRRYRKEVGSEPILTQEIANSLDYLLEHAETLKAGSHVVVCSDLVRTALASPLICQAALANLVIKTRQVASRTGNPVYFSKNPHSRAKAHVVTCLENSREANLSPSPFSDPTVVKQVLLKWRDRRWQKEWSNNGKYFSSTSRTLPYAAQTKIWLPTARSEAGITTFGRPTVGELIQFLTGHGWFRRHRFKIDGGPSQCRFCDNEVEDPEHLWSSCEPLEGVRQAIQDECIKDGTSVSFTPPYIWSVGHLIQFLRSDSMAELLAGPRVQQTPL